MPAALPKALVRRVIDAHCGAGEPNGRAPTQRELAARFSLSLTKVNELCQAWEEGACLEDLIRAGKTGTTTSTRLLDAATLAALKTEVDSNECAYLEQLADALFLRTGVAASEATICRGLKQLRYTRKLLYQRAREANAAKQREYEQLVDAFVAEDMVFVDEVGMDNTTHQRTRGYALVGERTTERMWWVRRGRSTAFVVMNHTGVLDWWIQVGGMGSADLCNAAAAVLVPHLRRFPGPNSILVMDNCRTHYNPEFLSIVRATGAMILPLPTYSPQYNPIESCFHVAKMWLRKHTAWVQHPGVTQFQALGAALASVTPRQCANFIIGCKIYTWMEEPSAAREREAAEENLLLLLLIVLLIDDDHE